MKLPCLRKASLYAFSLLFILGLGNTFASTVYSINRSIGVGGVSGYIETDGTIGALASENIIDWQLLLDDGLDTFTLLGPGSGVNSELDILGSAFSASATDLLFDFSSDSAQHVLFQNPSTGSAINYWCFDNLAGVRDGIQSGCANLNSTDESVGVQLQNFLSVDRSGVVSIGVAAVPIPAAIWLFGSGLLGLIGIARNKVA